MPIYEYLCPEHGKFEQIRFALEGVSKTELCPECGAVSDRVPSVPARAVFPSSRLRHLASKGIHPVEPGMQESFARAKRDRERKAEEARKKSIADALTAVGP